MTCSGLCAPVLAKRIPGQRDGYTNDEALVLDDQSHAGARPFGLAMRPSGRLSALIRLISSALSSKSNTCRLSAICLVFADLGIAAIFPCCTSHRSATWAMVLCFA